MTMTRKIIYIIGGCSLAKEKEPIRSIEKVWIENESNRTVNIQSEECGQLIEGRRSPSVFLRFRENEQDVYVIGGCQGPNLHSKSIETMKIINGKWKPKLLNDTCEISHSCAAFDPMSTKMMIFGGFDTHSCLSEVQIIYENLNAENKEQGIKVKTLKGIMPKLKNATVIEINEREFMIFGGWEDEKRTSKVIRRIRFNESFSDYEIDFEGFLPYPVEGQSVVQKGSSVFLIGGYDGCFVIPTIIRYDLVKKQSEVIDLKLKQKRENHISGIINDKYLIVAAGWDSKQALKSIEVFEVIDIPPYLVECKIEGSNELRIARNRPSALTI